MRKIVFDFDLTILWPLIIFAIMTLWHSVRAYRSLPPNRKEKWNARRVIWLSSVVLVAVCGLMLAPDEWKTVAAYLIWDLLSFIAPLSFVITLVAAWDYAKRMEWFRLGVCVILMLMIAASIEHFYHQKINADHVTNEAQ